MRVPRLLTTALLALATAFAVPAAPASAAEDATRNAAENYVALGDSYSSGTGAGDYSDLLCTRSGNAYPARWAQASAPASFTSATCGGAKTPDVLNNQVRYLDQSTTLVSISIGGNDSGFASTMLTCMFSSQSTCEQRLDEAADYARNELPGELDALYATIRDRAPNAEVVVVGYPYLYKEGGFCLSMGSGKREAINDGSDVLNQVISGRATAAGFSFADARPAFAGHEICTGDPWISSSNIHPTAEGHEKGYLPAFSAVVR
ncbi:SGNH/GDSL hydrolase family protein [Streptomyces verrucosisporus]|uniref:SGNH/GDSL hydrolase family protein n=1 Tax=Streptomyces verrucosisporus TaxID=1695161 RepID=UPI0019D2BD65|nr:SGNH/GDSL hydrolase family protein [Streptomyces verrucosisporus]MBN3928799.1 SGNH/GDSL hydrolase family protein [Streptomyces verrucosisporus]